MFVDPNATHWWNYVLDHLSLAFWFAALGIVWRFRHAVDNWISNFGKITEATAETQRMVMETHGMTTQIRDNHLAHLQEDLKNHMVREEATAKEHLTVLQSIDKNISILAERTSRRRKES